LLLSLGLAWSVEYRVFPPHRTVEAPVRKQWPGRNDGPVTNLRSQAAADQRKKKKTDANENRYLASKWEAGEHANNAVRRMTMPKEPQ